MNRDILEAADLRMEFAGLKAVNALDLKVEKGTIHAVIGPNGSGKTTLFNMISGIYRPTGGRIFFDGRDITGLSPFRVAALGIARTFQNLRIFRSMSVLENVLVGRHCRTREGFVATALRFKRVAQEEERVREKALETLRMMGLEDKVGRKASELPYGERRLMELARALASEPMLVMVDEPTAGMNENETLQTMEIIGRIRDLGVTVLLVEHHMKVIMSISDRISVLDHGEKIAEGTPDEIQQDERVIEAYLGEKEGMKNLLEIEAIDVHYGELQALKAVTLTVREGEIVALLGANGAGKSTTLKAVSGLLKPTAGRIRFQGEEISGFSPHRIVQRGIAHAPEGRAVIPHFTVRENLLVGAYTEKKKERIQEGLERAFDYFPILKERLKQPAGTLSGGEQQMLSIGRSLMSHPKLLLLDEPSLGLAPIITEQIFEIIASIHRGNTAILLVEQNAYAALDLAHRAYILEVGEVGLQGEAQKLKTDEEVKKKYLGG